jgi:Tfp pilus assembly protein FimT
MQLIQKLLSIRRTRVTRNGKIRGLSTAELVGIIVIVGILGALGGTYITGMISQSKTNTGNQNAQSLTTTYSSAIAGGATIAGTDAATVIPLLNSGVTAGTITYKMNPPIADASIGSYTLTGATFSYTGPTP